MEKVDRRPILKRIESEDDFSTTYKGHSIEIHRCVEGDFDISVHVNGGYVYDGFWGDCDNTMEEAVKEALKGAMILGSSN